MQSPYPTRWSSSRLYPTAVPVPVLAAPGLQGRALRTRRHLEVYALLDPHPLWPVSSGRRGCSRVDADRQEEVYLEISLDCAPDLCFYRCVRSCHSRQCCWADVGFPAIAGQGVYADVCRVGAGYLAGNFTMSTWVPFVWGWVNVLVLLVASFRIQGGL